MTDAEVACYKRHLSGAQAVLEYGTGGSTVLAAESGIQRLYCVDSDPAWLDKVRKHPGVGGMIAAGQATCVHVDIGPVGTWGKPRSKWRFLRWPRYAQRPWKDGFQPDLVLIDGRFRGACLMEAGRRGVPKIAMHDFWMKKTQRRLAPVLRFFDVIDGADTLAVLKPRANARGASARLLALLYRYNWR